MVKTKYTNLDYFYLDLTFIEPIKVSTSGVEMNIIKKNWF